MRAIAYQNWPGSPLIYCRVATQSQYLCFVSWSGTSRWNSNILGTLWWRQISQLLITKAVEQGRQTLCNCWKWFTTLWENIGEKWSNGVHYFHNYWHLYISENWNTFLTGECAHMHVPKVHKNKSLYKNVMYLGNSPYSYFHVGGYQQRDVILRLWQEYSLFWSRM